MAAKTVSARDRIRAKTIGSNTTRDSKRVEMNGETIEFRTPSIEDLEAARTAAGFELVPTGKKGADGNPEFTAKFKNFDRYSLHLLVTCAFEPESGQTVYTQLDMPNLLKEAKQGWLKTMLNFIDEFVKTVPEEAAKNSEATTPSETASS